MNHRPLCRPAFVGKVWTLIVKSHCGELWNAIDHQLRASFGLAVALPALKSHFKSSLLARSSLKEILKLCSYILLLKVFVVWLWKCSASIYYFISKFWRINSTGFNYKEITLCNIIKSGGFLSKDKFVQITYLRNILIHFSKNFIIGRYIYSWVFNLVGRLRKSDNLKWT